MKRNNIRVVFFAGFALCWVGCARPLASFSYAGDEQKAPANIEFENQSERAETYEWDFGDGSFSNDESPGHIYRSSGNYLVTLKARKGKKETQIRKRVVVDAPERCLVELETDYGTMTIWLFDATPQHRDNFLKLSGESYYDGLLFHRVINGFMIQGGDPESRDAPSGKQLGMGGPGYTIPAEFVDSLIHVKGALAAARTGDNVNPDKRSSGSQFYIVHGREVSDQDLHLVEARKGFRYSKSQREAYAELGGTPSLDRDYTVFGLVIDGLEVIDKIAAETTGQGTNRPVKDVKIKVRAVH